MCPAASPACRTGPCASPWETTGLLPPVPGDRSALHTTKLPARWSPGTWSRCPLQPVVQRHFLRPGLQGWGAPSPPMGHRVGDIKGGQSCFHPP